MTQNDTFDNLVDKHKGRDRPEQTGEEEQQADYLEINWEAHDSFIEGPLGSVMIQYQTDRQNIHVRIHERGGSDAAGRRQDIGDEHMTPMTPGTAVRVQRDGETVLTGELVDIIDDRPESVTYIVDEDGSLRFARGWVEDQDSE